MITCGICVNSNRLVIYNDIPMFIMDVLNHQAILINTMAPVIVNILQLALYGEVTPWFLTKPTITSNKENNNIEEKKQQESTNKAKDRSHSEQKIVNRGNSKNNKINNGGNGSDKRISNRFDPLMDNDEDSNKNKPNREDKRKDYTKYDKTLDSKRE